MSNKRIRTKGNGSKQEITLMTLLANESTSDARKLLKKYNRPDATSHADLEVKLAQLYFDAPDKVAIEKEMADIHPHKKWLIKVLKPFEQEAEKVEEVVKPVEEKKANASGCGCPSCEAKSNACGCSHSSFDGQSPLFKITEPTNIGTIAIVGILALTLYAITKK